MREKPTAILLALTSIVATPLGDSHEQESGVAQSLRAAPMRAVLPAFDDCGDRVDHRLFGRPGQLCVIDRRESMAARGGRRLFDCNSGAAETQDSDSAFVPFPFQE